MRRVPDRANGPITTLTVDSEADAVEALKAANVLGFGIVLRNRWLLDPDGDGSSTLVWDVDVLSDAPDDDPEEAEEATG
jgi:hypothetical protein